MTGVQDEDPGTKEDVSEGGGFRLPDKPLPIPGDALPSGFNDTGELLEGGMKPRLLANGNLLIPMRAESDDGRLIGDGMIEVAPGTPAYQLWIPFLPQPDSGSSEETDSSS